MRRWPATAGMPQGLRSLARGAQYMVGIPGEEGDLLALQQCQDCGRGEAGDEHECGSGGEAGVPLDGPAGGVEQRQGHQVDVVVGGSQEPVAGQGVQQHFDVGEFGSVGPSGGAAGTEDDGGVGALRGRAVEAGGPAGHR